MYRGYGRTRIWLIITAGNLLVVSLLGLTLRARRCFETPVISYDQLLQAHSHFAFSGWGFMTLFIILCAAFLPGKIQSEKAYSSLFLHFTSCFLGNADRFSCPGLWSSFQHIFYIYIIISYCFAFRFYKDIESMDRTVSLQFAKAVLFFLVISTAGPLSLGFIMAGGGN